MDGYLSAINSGLDAMRKWMQAGNITELPQDAFKLPKDCPLWKMDLSLAQASGIVSAMRRELAGGPMARA